MSTHNPTHPPASRGEKQVLIAARMYECRDTAKFLAGPHFDKRVQLWMKSVRDAMVRFQCRELEAVSRLCKAIEAEGGRIEAATILWLTAAAVEMIEPSTAATPGARP